jgi:peptidoglycan/xylan/chitin deacetylase (PgdA/CDA1 family)
MIYFTEHGYNAMFLRDIHSYLINKRPLPEKTIIITFDDGYKSFHSLVYPVLKKLNLKASVAVIAQSMDENWDYYYISWQQAQEMNKSGLVEVVSHTNTHKALPTLCPSRLSQEITISDKTIGKYLCYESNILVYPGGAYNNNTISAVKKEYKLGVTIMEGINTFGTNPFIVKRFKVFHGNTGEDLEKRFAI